MTPEQIEAAARKLCEIRGIDPDETIGIIEGKSIVFQWCIVADEIRAYLEIQEAINSILQPSPHVVLRPLFKSFCICKHSYLVHASHCLALDCDCDIYTEDTGAAIEANKTP